MKNEIRVYKNLVAIELVNMGYKIVRLETNIRQPQKTVFYFKNEGNLIDNIKKLREKYWD